MDYYDYDEKEKVVSVEWQNGWRGGGCTCDETIKSHFGDFVLKHKDILMEWIYEYVEQATNSLKLLAICVNTNSLRSTSTKG